LRTKTPEAYVRAPLIYQSLAAFRPLARGALPQQTFAASHNLKANGETLASSTLPPRIRHGHLHSFSKGQRHPHGRHLLQRLISYIDSSTGGKITGMIAAADKVLPLAGNYTKIVPGTARSATKPTSQNFATCSSPRASACKN